MKGKANKRSVLAALLLLLPLLCGCWGGREIDALFIVTGVALDAAEEQEKLKVAFQVAKIEAGSGDSGGSSSADSSSILLKTEKDTVTDAIEEFNRSGSRRIFLHHNQVILIGRKLAEQGISEVIDLFMRDQEARLEVPIVLVDGEAEEALAVEMPQKKISGLFLGKLLELQSAVSIYNRTRVLDFASALLDGSASAVPLAKVEEEEGEKTLKIEGMAVFQNGRMTGTLSSEEALGFIWAMGSVVNSGVTVKEGENKASFIIGELDAKRTLDLRKDGGFSLNVNVHAELTANELQGFDDLDPKARTDRLTALAEDAIRRQIENTFSKAQAMRADIFEAGAMAKRHMPQKWREVQSRWGECFADMRLSVNVRVTLPNTGKAFESLRTEEQAS